MSAAHPDWDSIGADWPNREASGFVMAGGIHWHVQRMGSGPRLLLLHGSGAATHSWRDLLPLLAAHFDVLAPDLPGHGFTRAPGRPRMTLPVMAGAVGKLCTALDFAPDVVVGHSAGMAVALRLVLDGPLAPDAVIGLNAALTPFRGLAGVVFPQVAKLLSINPFTPWLFAAIAGGPKQARKLIEGTGSTIDDRGLALYARMMSRPGHVAGALAMMANWDLDALLADLPGLGVPVHLIVGMRDRAVPPGEAIGLAETHSRIALHRVEGKGHLLHEEAPEMAAEMIRSILSIGSPA